MNDIKPTDAEILAALKDCFTGTKEEQQAKLNFWALSYPESFYNMAQIHAAGKVVIDFHKAYNEQIAIEGRIKDEYEGTKKPNLPPWFHSNNNEIN